MYRSTKTYGHECGFSAAFRQWRADSHCALLHGYALAVVITFEAPELDSRNWVVDFGCLSDVKRELAAMFDHKTLVAADDPEMDTFRELEVRRVIDLVVVKATGCEAFAELAHGIVTSWLATTPHAGRVRVKSVEVREHGANSAIYEAQR